MALSISVAISGTAAAQQAALEEVIVTARFRAESNEDAPAAITAFTATDIQETGIETPHDFIGQTPNMTIVQTQNPGNSFITIRGVSQARNSDMPVAVVIDGVLLSNPAQLNQQLFDIEQIEVLKGPQGALYGRNAIGGAITITTKQPGDEIESKIRVGADSGPGYMFQGNVSGPVGDSDTLKFWAGLSYSDTDGYLDNTYLNEKADPYQDFSARVKLLWEPTDNFSADFRYSRSEIDTTALYFVINNDWGFTAVNGISTPVPNDVNDTSVPIRVNNPGEGLKDLDNLSAKLDFTTDNGGTFTSITAWDDTNELLTGDAFDFRPIGQSFNELILGPFVINPIEQQFPGTFPPNVLAAYNMDWNQAQFLDVSAVSQELRYTSPEDRDFRWIVGAYYLATDRYISTGNLIDTGDGVARIYREPRTTTGFPADFSITNPQWTFLADSQDNAAWAVFTSMTYDFNDEWQGTFSLRYDEDTREQTTETPPGFIPPALASDLVTGQKRKKTWDAWQPKLTLRWMPQDNVTLYGDLSRGFRSGGFNQSGVALSGVAGVFDTFDEQIADTVEVGAKLQFNDNRLNTNFALYSTDLTGAYYFIFLVDSSTQNLGSLDKVQYQGFEFELEALLGDNFDLNLGLALTDSEVKEDASVPLAVGQEAPLVSDYTFNLGGTWHKPMQSGLQFFMHADYEIIGDTYWGPGDPAVSPLTWNDTVRDPVNILDLRVGIEGDDWSATVWSKNLLDEKYNDEYSTPFVWKALPMRWGVQYQKNF